MERSYIDLTGKSAIVTGGGMGIGRGIALRLAEAGADVLVADRNIDAAKDAREEIIGSGGRAEAGEFDVASQDSTNAMVEAAIGHFGKVDILVNNAGVGGAAGWSERVTSSPEDWATVFDVNVMGIVHGIQSVSGHMVERGSGKIVNIASIAGRRGSSGFIHYAASKASAINVTQAFAYKLAPHKINVNSVCPGHLWTPLWNDLAQRRMKLTGSKAETGRGFFESFISTLPMGREQAPRDIGNAVVFLASDRARNITGQALNVDGGTVLN